METASSGVLEITIELTGKRTVPAKEEREVIFKRVQDTVRSTKGTEKLAMLGKLCNSEDLHIDLSAAQSILSMFNTKQRGTALLSLLPCLLNHKDAITLATKNLTKKDQIQLDNSIGLVYGFSPLNPRVDIDLI